MADRGWNWLKLHRLWCRLGFDPDSYWTQTPRTFANAVRGAVEGLEQAQRNRLIHAWQIAKLVGFSKVPDLDKILRATQPRKPVRPMTTDEIEDVLDAWVARPST